MNVGNFTRSQPHFTRQLQNIKGPFRVWQETPNGGTTNFITGAGGKVDELLKLQPNKSNVFLKL